MMGCKHIKIDYQMGEIRMTKKIILHWEDEGLDEDHPLAYEEINCKKCCEMVHFANNEWMRSWVENFNCPTSINVHQQENNSEEGIYEGVYCFDCIVCITYGLDKEEFKEFINNKSKYHYTSKNTLGDEPQG